MIQGLKLGVSLHKPERAVIGKICAVTRDNLCSIKFLHLCLIVCIITLISGSSIKHAGHKLGSCLGPND